MTNALQIIILAAGKGTRMKSPLPKVMHKIANREMLNLVIDAASNLNPNQISIVASEDLLEFESEIRAAHPSQNLQFKLQKERLGTAHAVKAGLDSNQNFDKILVLYGDTPLIEVQTLQEMVDSIQGERAISVLGFDCFEENAYGRLVVDDFNNLQKIVEFKEASDEERQITLCNSGVVALDGAKAHELINLVKNDNAKGEFYLTDVVEIAISQGFKAGFAKADSDEVLGVNSKFELAQLEQIKQDQLRFFHLENGVTILDPDSVYFSFDTKIQAGAIIHQNVVFGPKVEIAEFCEIKPFSHIEGAKIAKNSIIGPFARIRPKSEIGENVKIGNFVETKKVKIGAGAKISHLTYVGDAAIGEEANIGAGVVTCNYDGFDKFETKIGAGAFVGSNSALIAPLEIGEGAIIAAGSAITGNVAKDEMAFARTRQVNKKDGAKKFKAKKND